MARGWESKSIESQQDDATREKAFKPALTAGQAAALERQRSLELTRSRLSADLARATVPAHRAMLERAIAEVDTQLSVLL